MALWNDPLHLSIRGLRVLVDALAYHDGGPRARVRCWLADWAPRRLRLGRRARSGPELIRSGDEDFDRHVAVDAKDQVHALAALDHDNRAFFARCAERNYLVAKDVVGWIAPAPDTPAELIEAAMGEAAELAVRLSVPREEIPTRLSRIASRDPIAKVRRTMLRELTERFPEERATERALASMLRDSDPENRVVAARWTEDVPVLFAAAADPGIPVAVRVHALRGLPLDDRRVMSALPPLLDDASAEVRLAATRSAGAMKLAMAAGKLVALLADDSADVRTAAAEALGAGLAGASGEQSLIGVLGTPDKALRSAAIAALAKIGGTAAAIVPLQAASGGRLARAFDLETRAAIHAIKKRHARGEPGGLSLARQEGGALSLTEDPAGALGLADED